MIYLKYTIERGLFMNQEYYFKNAKWVGAKERTPKTFSVLRGRFELEDFKNVNLNILGLGFFKCYINNVDHCS